ncbi:unnamed protein product [Triticum turgidum subsp. durum]|uniref:Uncharacterized protein n=1 Tax=Triticum turgidum subsp. durum TaxID=4567 RepID=A0A9R0SM02_TRITD|nr:unnamed protein product [Triticum turgidum subsp. durum]
MDTWAVYCAGADMPPPPIIDRTLIADPRGLYDIYCKGLPSDDEVEFVTSSVSSLPDDKLLATFTLPQELLRGIKDMLAHEAAKQGAPSARCSSLLAAFSLMWSCYCRAKQEQNQTKTTYFLFSVDHRPRLKPPVPDRYLGNCLGPAIATARHDEIAATGKEGLFAAFMALSDALQDEVGEGSQDKWDGCVERVKEAVKSGVLSVADSPRFRVYNLNFGFGKPTKVNVVSVAKTSAISVEEARNNSGGIEVGLSLPTSSMENFQRCFADAMQELAGL